MKPRLARFDPVRIQPETVRLICSSSAIGFWFVRTFTRWLFGFCFPAQWAEVEGRSEKVFGSLTLNSRTGRLAINRVHFRFCTGKGREQSGFTAFFGPLTGPLAPVR